MKPSFLSSTLSLLAFLCVLSVLVSIFTGFDVPEYAQRVIDGIIGAYIGSRIPSALEKEHSSDETTTPEFPDNSERE